MNLQEYLYQTDEKPLDNIVKNGGFCGIFRKIACVGDSLSSGEFEFMKDGETHYYDYYEYSWGQYLARDVGCTVYNFSQGGMNARWYCENYAEKQDFWNPALVAQAYILALGVNDVSMIIDGKMELGNAEDIDVFDYKKNKPTFAGYYGKIIQRYKEIEPEAKFFLMTMPKGIEDETRSKWYDRHAELLHEIAARLGNNCYILDMRKYAPIYDEEFRKVFYLGEHMNACGYRLTALMVESYMDFIIRNNMDDFRQVGFTGMLHHHKVGIEDLR